VSVLNFSAGVTVANAFVVGVGGSGDVCVRVAAATDVIADVFGYVEAGSGVVPVSPGRLLDTRDGFPTVDDDGRVGVLAAGEVLRLRVVGRGGVPGFGVSAVMLNVAAVAPSGGGHMTVWPCDDPVPSEHVSVLNFSAGVTVANAFVVGVGGSGDVCVRVAAATDVIADVFGYVSNN